MPQAGSFWLPNTAAHDRSQVTPCVICGGQSGTGAGFLRVLRFPCQFSFHQLLHIHESSYHPKLYSLDTDSVVK
jgi:hypothetical protein